MRSRRNIDIASGIAGIARLAEAFPQAFFVYEGRRKPLKIGIDRDIRTMLGGDTMSDAELNAALTWYCSNSGYLRACAVGAPRIDLEGCPSGEVTAEQAKGAAKQLLQRATKRARKAALAPVPEPAPQTVTEPAPVEQAPEPASPVPAPSPAPAEQGAPKRLGLADLKAASARRRAKAVV
jgi:ProP effector